MKKSFLGIQQYDGDDYETDKEFNIRMKLLSQSFHIKSYEIEDIKRVRKEEGPPQRKIHRIAIRPSQEKANALCLAILKENLSLANSIKMDSLKDAELASIDLIIQNGFNEVYKSYDELINNIKKQSRKIAEATKRGPANVLITNQKTKKKLNISEDSFKYITRKNVPDDTVILCYKGPGEIDTSIFFSEGAENLLYFSEDWKTYYRNMKIEA